MKEKLTKEEMVKAIYYVMSTIDTMSISMEEMAKLEIELSEKTRGLIRRVAVLETEVDILFEDFKKIKSDNTIFVVGENDRNRNN